MSPQEVTQPPVEVSVRNIGGIDKAAVKINSTVTVLVGRNATNRTSFLQAIMAGLGSENVNLKGDAETGSVELTIDGENYTRTLERQGGTVVFDGKPFVDDGDLADLFAFLLEPNEARQAVERGDDLYDLIMRPVDTDEINAEIERLESERDDIRRELEELDELEGRLPSLEERRTQLEEELDETRTEIEEKEAELEEIDETTEPTAVEERFEELRETRRKLERVRADISDEERVIEALREDHSELETQLDGLAVVEDGSREEIEKAVNRHRSSIQAIESSVNELQSVIQFNQSMLEGAQTDVLEALHDGEDGGPVTDQLVADNEDVVCWTCGSQVERNEIASTVELLQEAHSEKIEERNELRAEIEELEAERKHVERTRDERRRLSRELEEVDEEIEERTDRLESLRAEASELENEVETLEDEVDSLESEDQDERLAQHREVNELEFELDRLQSEREEVENEIEELEERLADRDDLERRRDEIVEEIEELRSRIERLEAEAVEQFNDQMDHILDLLEFENLERVWIERIETVVQEGRRKVPKAAFDLHVVRETESGSVYEDTVDHLSESEREVVGLVFALSGYLVHEVYEQVPFMLLDSLEALDAGRIAMIVDHFSELASNLVVALLPEDAAAVDDSYERITDI